MPSTPSPSPHTNSPSSGRLAPASADPAPLFVYGSLLFPDVLHVLIDRDPHRVPVTVTGWRVIALPERIYPGLIPDPTTTATGHLFDDLTQAERETLDAFEADIYTLTRVPLDHGRHAWTYACTNPTDFLPAEPWSPEEFTRTHLPTYVDRCTTWRHRHESSA
ncbi:MULTISPECIES: gamma-glutamylcyclotransferase family protein [unclassified Frankia]|uniref:gamma-glutamylcyclotransferase family protein n=1 Tax=unclassified Frankia TaxID=2632575 RepID=UPI001EF5F1E8|nr:MULTISPECIES: gamma-glutamylcyclotransferase family protein [unclassified Frankia]